MNLSFPFAARVAIPVMFVVGLLLMPSSVGGGSAIRRQAHCRDEGQATSQRPAVLAGREFSDAGSGEGRCERVSLEPGHGEL